MNLELLIYENMKKLSSIIDYSNMFEIETNAYIDGYQCFNSSIVEHNGKIFCAYRAASFNKDGLVDAMKTESGGESIILFGEIVDNKIINIREILPPQINRRIPFRITGLEDPRLFVWNDKIYALCSHPSGYKNVDKIEVVLVDIEEQSAIVLPDPMGRPHNKNWIPLVIDNFLYIITDVNPMRVFKLIDNELETVSISDISSNINIHGGSTPFLYNNKLYTIVHGRFFISSGYIYWHSIAEIKKDWTLGLKKFFYFDKLGTEFCCSSQIINGELVVSYSVDDMGSKFIRVPELELDRIL